VQKQTAPQAMEQRANSILTRLAATSSTASIKPLFPARASGSLSLTAEFVARRAEGDSPSESPKSRKALSSPEGLRCFSTTKDRAFLFLCCPESGITPVLPVWHFISEVATPRFRVRGGRNSKKQIG